jgi:hypothetical protein
MNRSSAEGKTMKTLVRALQCLLALAFLASLYHVFASAAFWIALYKAQDTRDLEFIDYIGAFSGPVVQLLRNVQYLAFGTILELMLRIQQMMSLRRPTTVEETEFRTEFRSEFTSERREN